MSRIKNIFFGNYKNEDDYLPNLKRRFINKLSMHKESGRFCSCGIFRCCMWHYIFPVESEKMKIKTLSVQKLPKEEEDAKS